jgi:hypothetical protein
MTFKKCVFGPPQNVRFRNFQKLQSPNHLTYLIGDFSKVSLYLKQPLLLYIIGFSMSTGPCITIDTGYFFYFLKLFKRRALASVSLRASKSHFQMSYTIYRRTIFTVGRLNL